MLTGCREEEPVNPNDIELTPVSEFISALTEEIENEQEHRIQYLKDLEVKDAVNNLIWKFDMILPFDYSDNREYRVLYLLHGKDGSGHVWESSLRITKIFNYFANQGLNDLIIVMPDASNTYYVDDYEENIKYETFFHKKFIPYIEENYSVSRKREKSYIAGFSMGGYGAAYYSFKYKDKFSLCYAMSAPLDGNSNYLTPSIFDFIKDGDTSSLPYLIMDIGDHDQFVEVNKKSHLVLNNRKVAHEFILREGLHNVKFWKESLMLLFNRLLSESPIAD